MKHSLIGLYQQLLPYLLEATHEITALADALKKSHIPPEDQSRILQYHDLTSDEQKVLRRDICLWCFRDLGTCIKTAVGELFDAYVEFAEMQDHIFIMQMKHNPDYFICNKPGSLVKLMLEPNSHEPHKIHIIKERSPHYF